MLALVLAAMLGQAGSPEGPIFTSWRSMGASSLLTGLVSYYAMEGNGNDALGANNGTPTAVTFSAGNGKVAQGAGYTGATSAIAIPASASLDIVTDMTISCWLYNTADSDYYTAVAHMVGGGGVNNVNYNLIKIPSSQLQLHTQSDTGVVGPNLGLTVWTHIVVTRDTSGNVEWFVNGASWGTGLGAAPYSKPTATTQIGSRADAYSYWHGRIDEVGIWSRKLTSAEVAVLYNSGTGRTHPFPGAP